MTLTGALRRIQTCTGSFWCLLVLRGRGRTAPCGWKQSGGQQKVKRAGTIAGYQATDRSRKIYLQPASKAAPAHCGAPPHLGALCHAAPP
jgi:hypothetical protein